MHINVLKILVLKNAMKRCQKICVLKNAQKCIKNIMQFYV